MNNPLEVARKQFQLREVKPISRTRILRFDKVQLRHLFHCSFVSFLLIFLPILKLKTKVIHQSKADYEPGYNFAFLKSMNNLDQEVTSAGLADELVIGANDVFNELVEADEKLKQYFFEMIVVASQRNIQGKDNLQTFLELTWKVWFFFLIVVYII